MYGANAITQPVSIKKAAQLTGLSEHTLRYYEKIGLTGPIERDKSSGHRMYSDADISTLQALSYLKICGFKVADMRRYLSYLGNGKKYAYEAKELFLRHEEEFTRQLEYLALQHKYIKGKVAYWEAVINGDEEAMKEVLQRNSQLAQKLIDT